MGSAESSQVPPRPSPNIFADVELVSDEFSLKKTKRKLLNEKRAKLAIPPEAPYQTVDELIKMKTLTIGDPIEVEDNVLRHWALYAGEAEREPMVIHLFSLNGKPHEVRYDPLIVAVDGKRCRINKKYDSVLDARPADEIMQSAHAMLGSKEYNIIKNNCEHFVTGCRYGFFISEQVQEASNSWLKKAEIARSVLSNGFNTATYTFKGFFS